MSIQEEEEKLKAYPRCWLYLHILLSPALGGRKAVGTQAAGVGGGTGRSGKQMER